MVNCYRGVKISAVDERALNNLNNYEGEPKVIKTLCSDNATVTVTTDDNGSFPLNARNDEKDALRKKILVLLGEKSHLTARNNILYASSSFFYTAIFSFGFIFAETLDNKLYPKLPDESHREASVEGQSYPFVLRLLKWVANILSVKNPIYVLMIPGMIQGVWSYLNDVYYGGLYYDLAFTRWYMCRKRIFSWIDRISALSLFTVTVCTAFCCTLKPECLTHMKTSLLILNLAISGSLFERSQYMLKSLYIYIRQAVERELDGPYICAEQVADKIYQDFHLYWLCRLKCHAGWHISLPVYGLGLFLSMCELTGVYVMFFFWSSGTSWIFFVLSNL